MITPNQICPENNATPAEKRVIAKRES